MRKRRLLSIGFILIAILFILRSERPGHVEWPSAPDVYRNGQPRHRLALNQTLDYSLGTHVDRATS